jgi:ParB family transcriptional regulator, chromosome partitioning protein
MQALKEVEPKVPATFKVAQPTRHLDSLRPHPSNPREEIDKNDPSILELAESIARHGVIEPLVILPDGTVVAGHRRRVAIRVAVEKYDRPDLLIVPVIIKNVEPSAVLEIMLHENMQRQSLSLLEEARAMHAIMEEKKMNVADLSRHLAIQPKFVSQRLGILKCEVPVQALFHKVEYDMPLSSAPWLSRIVNKEKQIQYAGLIARRQITLAALENVANAEMMPKPKPKEEERQTAADIPKPEKRVRSGNVHPITSNNLPPTRQEAMGKLEKLVQQKRGASIPLSSFASVVRTVCCACGMEGKEDVCRTCPFPRIIMGVIGRAD